MLSLQDICDKSGDYVSMSIKSHNEINCSQFTKPITEILKPEISWRFIFSPLIFAYPQECNEEEGREVKMTVGFDHRLIRVK